MELFLARQPIFDKELRVYAYELLYRNSEENRFSASNDGNASMEVMSSSLVAFGLDKVAGQRACFLNVDNHLLLESCHTLVPASRFILEILETVPRTEEVIEACTRLRKLGYKLALDDFDGNMLGDPLLKLADVIKVDFRATSRADRQRILKTTSKYPAVLLAEKVETQEEFHWARESGFEYFQGFFFARPSLMRCKDIPGFKLNYVRIIREVHEREIDIERLAVLVRREVSLLHRLLRYINSPLFSFRNRISSVQEALTLLGEKEIKRWVCLATLPSLASDKPAELVVNSMVRAKFAENLAIAAGMRSRSEELFVTGMLSHLDAMLDRPMPEILTEIPLPETIRNLLCSPDSAEGTQGHVFEMVLRHEAADWPALERICVHLGISPATIREAYQSSLQWAAEIYSATPA